MQSETWALQHIRRSELCITIKKEETRIGRKRHLDFESKNIYVSRDHAVFFLSNRRFYVKDNKSANGTYVNGIKISPSTMVEIFENDEVGLGLHRQLEMLLPNLSDTNDSDINSANLIFIVKHTVIPLKVELSSESSSLKQSDVRQQLNLIMNNNAVNSSSSRVTLHQDAIENAEDLLQILAASQFENEENNIVERENVPIPQNSSYPNNNSTIVLNNESDNRRNGDIDELPNNIAISTIDTHSINVIPSRFSNGESENECIARNSICTKGLVNGCIPTVSLSHVPNVSVSIENDGVLMDSKLENREGCVDVGKESADLEIKEEGAIADIKMEPLEETSVSYTVENDFIVISDDEDYDDHYTNGDVNDDSEKIYNAIKKELEIFDEVPSGTVIHNVWIDDDDDAMSFSSWLEDNEEPNKVESELSRTDKTSNDDSHKNRAANWFEDNQDEEEPNKVESELTRKTDKTSNDDSHKNRSTNWFEPNKVESELTRRTVKTSNDDSYKNRSTNWFEDNQDKEESNKVESELTKRTDKTSNNDSYKNRTTNWFEDNQDKEEPNKVESGPSKNDEISNKKLREIALKSSVEAKTKVDVGKISAAKKVKVSESRGSFLVGNDNPVPSTSKNESVQPVAELDKFRIPTIPKRKVPIIPPHTEKNKSKKPLNNNNNNEGIPSNSRKSETVKQPPRYISQVENNYNNAAPSDDVDEIVDRMLHWNPYWFVEYKKSRCLPPQVYQGQLQKMPKRFSSYDEYYNIVTPAMMMEFWSSLNRDYELAKEQQKGKFSAVLTEVNVNPSQTTLHYYTYIDKQQSEMSSHVKRNDAVIVNYDQEVENKFALGLVTRLNKTFLQKNDIINKNFVDSIKIFPYVVLNFKVVITSIGRPVSKGVNILRTVASISPTLRTFKSVKVLRYSNLLPHILHPNVELYTIQLPSSQQQLYCKGNLNESQKKAVLEASYICQRSAPGIYLIQGPPGTGKTTVILNILEQILYHPNYLKKQMCILLLAPSNAAVDELVFRLSHLKTSMKAEGRELKLIRYGSKHMHHSVMRYSLDEIAKSNVQNDLLRTVSHDNQQLLKRICKDMGKLQALTVQHPGNIKNRNNLAIVKRDYDKTCRRVMAPQYNIALQKCEQQLLSGAEIICTTLSSCITSQMEDIFRRYPNRIGCCIVDETTQSNEQEVLTPLKLGVNKFVLVGDPKQLPGVVQNRDVKNSGYGESLFSRIMSNFPNDHSNPVQLLNVQYRMHPEISQFPNRTFYNGRLQDSDSVKTRPSIFKNLRPYVVFNFDMESIIMSQEYVNKPETFCVIKILNVITKRYTNNYSIGIVTPYNNQKSEITRHLKMIQYRPNITVNTVDSFQGQEKDIIIMSCVRENTNNFLNDEQRLNVAVTRARHALIIIGSSSLFMTSSIFGTIRDDARRRKLFIDVFPDTTEKQLLNYLLYST
ncbi:hypothetical protein RI129_008431 [Pyrocoelia pectoralis]|uniref:FHA domain-containing protein n=1 Tax=Pyrocoelia pectoralis TaxID=417401 RepID=A0AAN7V9W3_9COLE